MMQITLNESTAALRRIPLYLVDATDGVTPETSITFASGDIKVSENGAAQANHAGSVTEVGLGLYHYECAAGEVDVLGYLSIIFTKSGVRTFHAMAQVVPATVTPDAVDGQSYATMMEDVMAVLYGVTAVPDPTTVDFKKISDGTTTTRTVTYGVDGERLTST